MRGPVALTIIVAAIQIQYTICLFDPISVTIGGSIGVGIIATGYQKFVKCRISECCNSHYIPIDVSELERQLMTRLHGQQIAQRTIIGAFNGYSMTEDPPKALAISFHGLPGSGKNFVARIIAETFYKKGTHSDFYHFFNGRSYAPVADRLQEYKEKLTEEIASSLSKCERSMFVFDEVDMMPVGLLNVLVPFLDYVKETWVETKSGRITVTSNKAIFIFLSNTGSNQIMQQMVKFWMEGKNRDIMTLKDFEHLIAVGAFNEKGGFESSDTIRKSIIDYYVPFLPLEVEHVKLCMRDAFKSRMNSEPTQFMEEEVLSVVTYGPHPHNIYSKSGCKKIEQRVLNSVYRRYHAENL